MLIGKHLIAGEWVGARKKFENQPTSGHPDAFAEGSVEHVNAAVGAAEAAYVSFAGTSREKRAEFLNQIADELELRGSDITSIGVKETGLPTARLEGELGRTTGQLRLFASLLIDGDYLDRRHDEAQPDRSPPRPDLRLIQRPIGPVAIFGASNFPLAFSVAGGDTASALAAGCPVVVKGHPAHPGTSDVVAQAVSAAVKACAVDTGVFSLVQSSTFEVGQALVDHPQIAAVGFTGSLAGGRALYERCCLRPTPIPFFGELGSINPIFVLPSALETRAEEIGEAWAESLTSGVGQFCTNPGIIFVQQGEGAVRLMEAALSILSNIDQQVMLTEGIAKAFKRGSDNIAGSNTRTLLKSQCEGRFAKPELYLTNADDWLNDNSLSEEVFGPLGVIVTVSDMEQMLEVAAHIEGQLTCTLQLDQNDSGDAQPLLQVLERKAGRLLANGYPTGVEVCDAMVHGGPYPASTNFGHTSVGTLAIRRWLRPVCFQNMPQSLLPEDLR